MEGMENHTPEAATWSVPQCPFTVQYSTRVLDDIRLAVVDAFYSLPRGGAEIGGILLGNARPDKVSISGYLPLDCEHALGPSFTLSERDEQQLRDLLNSPECLRRESRSVGWYHSHTRSEINLTEADLDLYRRFFPESWQVALLLKPHTFLPTRAGFFFREAGGAIQSSASYREFELDPLPMRPPRETPAPAPAPAPLPGATVANSEAPADPPAASPAAETDVPEAELPKFLRNKQEERSWRGIKRILAVATGLALGCIGFATRELWLYPVLPVVHPSSVLGSGVFGLSTVEFQGQLQVRWNPYAPKVRKASSALLEILDGSNIPHGVFLDANHLSSGVFTYARQSERVDVSLVVQQPNGAKIRETTTFLGPKPLTAGAESDRVKKLEADLAAQTERANNLENDLNAAKARLKARRQKKAPEPGPLH